MQLKKLELCFFIGKEKDYLLKRQQFSGLIVLNRRGHSGLSAIESLEDK